MLKGSVEINGSSELLCLCRQQDVGVATKLFSFLINFLISLV